MTLTVLKPGLQTTIQSRPRAGMRHLGVPSGGAADALSMALANKLVGNSWDAPVLEATLLGPTLRFEHDTAAGIAGATAALHLNGQEIEPHKTLFAREGDVLEIGATSAGARVYLGVPGGFEADEVLGSAATNLQAAFGGFAGAAIQEGDRLQVAGEGAESLATPAEFRPPMTSSWGLRSCAGAETGLLDDASVLFGTNWVVDRRADRMGLRLEGPHLEIASEGRMPSAGVLPGTVQCPEDGAPYLLSVDAGTVGGYPRIAQVARVDRHLLGQLRPGDHVRLLHREPKEAVTEFRAKLDYWRKWLPQIAEIL
ncbi:MAG TPA: biotin-dependent carboxyltransferase family protein [Woeseiaceae bacterium]|jgi:allophanate hydrolase|nr:biotin-dependent carboxyltransferase family protein [Woeseiaceae bacterium]